MVDLEKRVARLEKALIELAKSPDVLAVMPFDVKKALVKNKVIKADRAYKNNIAIEESVN